MPRKTIMTGGDIRRTLARMAHEIVERNRSTNDLMLVGIQTRGVTLAQRLAADIQTFEDIKMPVGALDIGPFRDDLSFLKIRPKGHRTAMPSAVDGKSVILVDDVLYTGRTIRAAMDALVDRGRPRLIQLAVLIDRGHREMPIGADYVGKNIPSSKDEDIQVRLTEIDGVDEVSIMTGDDRGLTHHSEMPLKESR